MKKLLTFILLLLMLTSCKTVFIWTTKDIVGLVLFGLLILLGLILLIDYLYQKIARYFNRKRKGN